MEDETLSSHVLSISLLPSRCTATNVMPQILKEQALSRHISKLLDGRQTIRAKIAFKCQNFKAKVTFAV